MKNKHQAIAIGLAFLVVGAYLVGATFGSSNPSEPPEKVAFAVPTQAPCCKPTPTPTATEQPLGQQLWGQLPVEMQQAIIGRLNQAPPPQPEKLL